MAVIEVRVTKIIAGGTEDANDVLSESTSAGADWDFGGVVDYNGVAGEIIGALAISESESVVPSLTLFLFNAAPTGCNLNDDAPNTAPDSTDLANVIGSINFPAMESIGTTDSMAVATPNTPNSHLPLPFKCALDSRTIYGVLATRTAFTQTAGDDMTMVLLVRQL